LETYAPSDKDRFCSYDSLSIEDVRMPNENDFERAWLAKLSQCLDELAGEEIRKEVMEGSDGLSAPSNSEQVIAWSARACQWDRPSDYWTS
jgi:hypothetical protein